MMKRLDFLDIAKGIGIILVLYSHSCGFPIFGYSVVAFYMPLFFFISGYVYKEGRRPVDNIKRKLKQLLIPYAGFTLLLYAENIVVSYLKNELSREVLINPLLGALYSRGALWADMSGENTYFLTLSNGPMWFITAMAVASVIFYLLVDKFLENMKNMWIISGILAAITIVMSYCPVLLPWSMDTAFACALFMLVGAKCGQISYYSDENKKNYNIFYVLLAALAYCVVTQSARAINLSIRDYGYPGIIGAMWFLSAALAGVIIFLWICKYLEKFKFTNIFKKIGKHTFTIMALHIVLVKYLNKAYFIFKMSFTFDRSCIWYWVYWTVLFVVVIAICILFDIVMDKIKKGVRIWKK